MAKIVVNLALRRLSFYVRNQPLGDYPVAIGKPETPTPSGTYQVTNKIVNPGGILGSRWLGLSIPTDAGPYGIHGTPHPWTIGKAISNGCIRMYNDNVEAIFPLTPVGTTVEIVSCAAAPGEKHPAPGARKHVVRSGDTLWRLSRQYGLSLDELLRANPGVDPLRLMPGQELVIP
ncbi:hypothetical protein SY88_19315 [Clostridiales bacterium PH28_bin88]|nr:hypothetical protein SY88_19315 [Clostridiales bacterium PH28_bin88]